MLWGFVLQVIGALQTRHPDDLRLAREGTLEDIARHLEGLRPALASGLRRAYPSLDEAADDVIQNAFVEMLADDARVVRGYRGQARLTSFVHGIVRRRAIDYLRRAPAAADPLPADELQLPAPRTADPAVVTADADFNGQVRAAIERLSPRDQQVVRLYYMADQDCQQIADTLGVSAKRVTSLLCEARSKLRSFLSPLLEGRKSESPGPAARLRRSKDTKE